MDALSEASGRPWWEVKQLLGGLVRSTGPEQEKAGGTLILPDRLGPLLPVHRRYLEGRGLDPDVMEQEHGFRGIGLALKLAWRVWIPIRLHGKTVSWTTRSVVPDAEVRYVNARTNQEAIKAKHLLYNEDLCGHAIIVVEGCMSAVKVGKGCVATMGVNVTDRQVARIASKPVRAICLDAQPQAQARARELCRRLAPFPGVTVNVVLESAKAPDDASEEELNELRRRFLA